MLILLILATLVLPFVWGWLAYWIIERLWPMRSDVPPVPTEATPWMDDFQI